MKTKNSVSLVLTIFLAMTTGLVRPISAHAEDIDDQFNSSLSPLYVPFGSVSANSYNLSGSSVLQITVEPDGNIAGVARTISAAPGPWNFGIDWIPFSPNVSTPNQFRMLMGYESGFIAGFVFNQNGDGYDSYVLDTLGTSLHPVTVPFPQGAVWSRFEVVHDEVGTKYLFNQLELWSNPHSLSDKLVSLELSGVSWPSSGSMDFFLDNLRIETQPVPEPQTWMLLGIAGLGLVASRIRHK